MGLDLSKRIRSDPGRTPSRWFFLLLQIAGQPKPLSGRGKNMYQSIQIKAIMQESASGLSVRRGLLVVSAVFLCLGLCPAVHAVSPPPDGGYSGANTAEGTEALQNLTSGLDNTAVGYQSLFTYHDRGIQHRPGVSRHAQQHDRHPEHGHRLSGPLYQHDRQLQCGYRFEYALSQHDGELQLGQWLLCAL